MNKVAKKLLIYLITISIVISLGSDLIYGTKEKAEEYSFGYFLSHISSFSLTLITLIVLFSLMWFFIRTNIFPEILDRIIIEDSKKKVKGGKK